MQSATDFNTGVIKPVECMKEGWELIKDDYWLFFGVTLLGLLIGGAVPLFLIGPMMCGIYLVFLKKRDGEKYEFGDLFKGFDYFTPSLIATIIIVAVFMVVAFVLLVIPYFIFIISLLSLKGSGNSPLPFIAFAFFAFMMFVFGVLVACVHALLVFTHLLIVDRKLSGWDAIKLSTKASRQNLSGVVGFIVVQFVLSILGLMALVVGAYLVLPIIYAGTTVMYRKIFPPMFIPPPVN